LYLYQNDFNKSVADIDKAIEKSEDNIPKYFFLRGLIFAVFGNFSQAIQDLTVAINLD
jgi:tetratricopeptide (TPR) repeat protein